MPNSFFQFRQFRIVQDRCAMKVGTDGVLLGAWTPCSSARHVLDVGTGTGLLALMLAQRCPGASVEAVEIDPDAAAQAADNVRSSPWHDRILVRCTSFQAFAAQSLARFDTIVCNPPYFRSSLHSPDARRTAARHADGLPLDQLVSGVVRLLSPDGAFSVVLPLPEGESLLRLCLSAGLFLRRRTWVYPMRRSPQPKRVLLSFGFSDAPAREDSLVIEEADRHDYSDAYRRLTSAFYL